MYHQSINAKILELFNKIVIYLGRVLVGFSVCLVIVLIQHSLWIRLKLYLSIIGVFLQCENTETVVPFIKAYNTYSLIIDEVIHTIKQ